MGMGTDRPGRGFEGFRWDLKSMRLRKLCKLADEHSAFAAENEDR